MNTNEPKINKERQLVTLADIKRRFAKEYNTALYGWVRHITIISMGALTLLVSLQKSYIPPKPSFLWVLHLSWVALALNLGCGILVLHGEHRTIFDAINELIYTHKVCGEKKTMQLIEEGYTQKKIYKILYQLFLLTLGIAFVCLALFAVANHPSF